MKKILLYILTIAVVFVFFSTRLSAQQTRTFDFTDFTGVDVGWGMHVNISQSSNYSIEVTADEADFEILKVEKKGSSVIFYIDRNNYRKRDDIEINIKMPVLTGFNLSGGSKGKVSMNISSKNFKAELSGGARLDGELSCGNSDFSLSGGSSIKLSGKGNNLDIEGSGGCVFNLKQFSVKDVNADLSGGSQATVTMDGTLDSDQSGGSRIVYFGNAKIGNTDFSGGSGISKGN